MSRALPPAYSAHALGERDHADATLLSLVQVTAFASDRLMALPQEAEFAEMERDWQESIYEHSDAQRHSGARVWVLDCWPSLLSARRTVVGVCSVAAVVHNAPSYAVTQPPTDIEGAAVASMQGNATVRWHEFDMAILAVLPAHEGNGGASALVALVEREASKYPRSCVTLDVASSRYPRARRLYERLGYVVWRESDVPGQEHKMVKIINAGSDLGYKADPMPAPAAPEPQSSTGTDKRRRIAFGAEVCLRAACPNPAEFHEATPERAPYCSPACQRAHHAA